MSFGDYVTRLGRVAGLSKKQYDSPGEIAASLFVPTYMTGKILNSARGKEGAGFKSNVELGAAGEALAGAAYFGGAELAGGGAGVGAGAGAGSGGGSGIMSYLGLGGSPAAPLGAPEATALGPSGGGAYVAGAPAVGPYEALPTPTSAYVPGAAGPGPFALPGQEASAAELAPKPSFLSRAGQFSDAYSRARQASQPSPTPPAPALPTRSGPAPAPMGPVNLSPTQAAGALAPRPQVDMSLLPPSIQAILLGRPL